MVSGLRTRRASIRFFKRAASADSPPLLDFTEPQEKHKHREGVITISDVQRARTESDASLALNTADSSPTEKLSTDFRLLRHIFPDFPASMLRLQLAREKGNSKNVYDRLQSYGWKGDSPLYTLLRDTNTEHFSTKYYWGEYKEEYITTLKQQAIGSYLTAWKDQSAVLCCLTQTGHVKVVPTKSITVKSSQEDQFSLRKALNRPSHISRISLLPFLRTL